MRNASLYSLTAEICGRVLSDARPADALIAKYFRERTFLGSHDRRFISDTMYALIRHQRRLEAIAAIANANVENPPISGPLALLGAFVATHPTDRPVDLVVAMAEAAQCEMSAADQFVESCTNTVVDSPEATTAERIAIQLSYPDWLVNRIIAERGEEEAEQLCTAMNVQAPITIRVNELTTTVPACADALLKDGTPTLRGLISSTALRLQKRVNIFQTPVFKLGWFEMQDEGSQTIALFADPHPTWKILDACAGAGGKTLHFAALMKNKGEIFALVQNEFQDAELRRRLRRASAQNVRVVNGTNPDTIKKMAGTMNIVLIDAPCSGTGTIRRNPIAKWRLSEDKIAGYVQEQKNILMQYKDAVRPQGKLVYATCSILKEENAEVAAWFLANNPEFALDTRGTRFATPAGVKFADDPTMRTPEGYLELLPHRNDTDGFFAAAFTRTV